MSGLTHRTKRVDGTKWHWVEAGDGEPVVLLHGIPESWQCWKHQIPALATQFRVLAFDLKGYGQSDKKESDYTGTNVARELIAVLDSLGVDRFRLAGHDWGSIIGDHVCDHIPDRNPALHAMLHLGARIRRAQFAPSSVELRELAGFQQAAH